MAKLRRKVWDFNDMAASNENQENENHNGLPKSEHELINVNRELVKVEKSIISFRKKTVNETSVCRISFDLRIEIYLEIFSFSVDLGRYLIDINFRLVLICSIKSMKWLG